MSTNSDEQQIRDLIATWMRATTAGDLDTVLDLMADDVVFLLPNQAPMRGREAFAAASRMMAGKMKIEGTSDIQEIRVEGNIAYCWNYLTLAVTPTDGGPAMKRAGNILSVFRREADGKWRLFRDANLLMPVK